MWVFVIFENLFDQIEGFLGIGEFNEFGVVLALVLV